MDAAPLAVILHMVPLTINMDLRDWQEVMVVASREKPNQASKSASKQLHAWWLFRGPHVEVEYHSPQVLRSEFS